MQHRHDAGADAGRAQRRAAGGRRHAARARRRARLARADLRAAGQPQPRGGSAQSRARRAQPAAVHARDDRRGLRHARADPPDPRRARGGGSVPGRRRAKPTASTDRRRRAGISGRCCVLEARVALRRGQPGPAVALASDVAVGRRPAGLRAPGGAHRGRGAARRRTSSRRRSTGSTRVAGRISPTAMSGTWGEFLRLRGRLHADCGRIDRGVPRLRPERQRVRAARRAASGRPELPGARAAGRVGRRAVARDALSHRRHRDLRGARRRARSRGGAPGAGRESRPRRPAATSACRWTATMRSSAGSSTPR